MKKKESIVNSLTSGISGLCKKNKIDTVFGSGSIKDKNTVVVD